MHVEHVLAAMQPLLTQLLNLPGMDVEDYQERGHEMILKVEGGEAMQAVRAVDNRVRIYIKIIGIKCEI